MADKSSENSSPGKNSSDLAMVDYLSDFGVKIRLESNRSIDLTRSGYAYFVIAGCVDIFAVRNPAADIAGPRLNIIRVEPGNLIFGIHPDEVSANVGFIGIAGTRTELLEMRFDDFCRSSQDLAQRSPLADLLEKWVKDLLEALCPGLGQKPVLFSEVKPGYSSEIADREVLGVRHGLVWVSGTGGLVRFMGRADLENFSRAKALPLSAKSWVSAEKSSVSVLATIGLTEAKDELSRILTDFHSLVVKLVRLQYDRIISEQTRMLVQEKDQEKRLVESALETLSSTIIKDRRDFGEIKGRP